MDILLFALLAIALIGIGVLIFLILWIIVMLGAWAVRGLININKKEDRHGRQDQGDQ